MTIEDQWEKYYEQVLLKANAAFADSPAAVIALRRTFYAGAVALMHNISAGATEEDVAHELVTYVVAVAEDKA